MFFKLILEKHQIEVDSAIDSIFGIATMVLVELRIITAIIFSIFNAFIPTNIVMGTRIAFVVVAIIFGGYVAFDRGGVKSKKS